MEINKALFLWDSFLSQIKIIIRIIENDIKSEAIIKISWQIILI